MNILRKKLQIDVLTLIIIMIGTGVASVQFSQSSFGQGIAGIVAIAGLFFISLGVWIFLHLFQDIYGSRKSHGKEG